MQTLVEMIVNSAYTEQITEEQITGMLKEKVFPVGLREHMEVFFTEVPVPLLNRFRKEHGIALEQLKEYYDLFIKTHSRNKKVEELFYE